MWPPVPAPLEPYASTTDIGSSSMATLLYTFGPPICHHCFQIGGLTGLSAIGSRFKGAVSSGTSPFKMWPLGWLADHPGFCSWETADFAEGRQGQPGISTRAAATGKCNIIWQPYRWIAIHVIQGWPKSIIKGTSCTERLFFLALTRHGQEDLHETTPLILCIYPLFLNPPAP